MVLDPFGSVSLISNPCHASSGLGEVAIITSADTNLPWVEDLSSEFERQGHAVQHKTIDDPPDHGRFVVCVLDVHIPYLEQLTENGFTTFKDFLAETQDTRLLWVTPPTAHRKCENPGFGTIHGLARTVRKELGLDISILEVDVSDPRATQVIVSVCKKINTARDRIVADQDYEFVADDGTVYTPRSHRSAFAQELSSIPAPESVRCLTIDSIGHLDTIRWTPAPSPTTPLGDGEVDVDVAYVGVNFRVGFLDANNVPAKDPC